MALKVWYLTGWVVNANLLFCHAGCFCNGSTVLLNDTSTECVVPENCPAEQPEHKCQWPEGRVYQECGTACPLTCDNKDDNITCTKQCVPGKQTLVIATAAKLTKFWHLLIISQTAGCIDYRSVKCEV